MSTGNSDITELVLDTLDRAGSHGLALEELAAALVPGEVVPVGLVDGALATLRERGLAVVWARRWRAVRVLPWIVATVVKGRSGLEARERTGRRAWQLAPARAKGALPGDLVLLRPERAKRSRGRKFTGLADATVLEILRARSRRFVGCLVGAKRGLELLPWDVAATPAFASLDTGAAAVGEWVVVEAITRGRRASEPHGRVVERLGSVDDPRADSLVVCRAYAITTEFPPEVLEAAAAVAATPLAAGARIDRRSELAVTVDGADAKDFDDAITVARHGKGWRVGIHIADVAAHVVEGGAIDLEARRRGTSVYLAGRVVPMLPPVLADDLCSLRPGVERATVSVWLDCDHLGNVVRRQFERSTIVSRRRLTYEQAQELLDGKGADPELDEMFRDAAALLNVLLARRRERGSLDLDLPAVKVRLGPSAELESIELQVRLAAHRLVEELMILANRAVAEALQADGRLALQRVHGGPDTEDLDELANALEALGLEVPHWDEEPDAGSVQRLLDTLPPGPLATVAAQRVLRATQRAVYAPNDHGHWALGLTQYLHFTSPIRRYPDLIAHRRLGEMIAGQVSPAGSDLVDLGAQLSTSERAAESAERDLSAWKRIRALAGREGDIVDVTVTEIQKFGAFVRLDREWIDALLPAWRLGDGPFLVTRAGTELRSASGSVTVRLGERMRARITRVDGIRRQVDLEPVEPNGNQPATGAVDTRERPRHRRGKEPKSHENTTPGGRRPRGQRSRDPGLQSGPRGRRR